MNKTQEALNSVVENSCPKRTNYKSCDTLHRCNALMKDEIDKIQQLIDCQLSVEEIELFEFMSTTMKSKACFNENTKSLYESVKTKLDKQKELYGGKR